MSGEDDYRHGIYDPRYNTWVDAVEVEAYMRQFRGRRGSKYNQKVIPPEPKVGRVKSKTKRLGGNARIAQIHRLALRDGGMRCFWCKVELSFEIGRPEFDREDLRYPTVDHYPKAKRDGGDNSDQNSVLACRRCNNERENWDERTTEAKSARPQGWVSQDDG